MLLKTLKNITANVDEEIYKNQDNVLTGKQYLLLIPLTRFFCQTENIDKLKTILDGKSKLSLRLVDWFVTNYAKKNYTVYGILPRRSSPELQTLRIEKILSKIILH